MCTRCPSVSELDPGAFHNHDLFDALIASLVARAVMRGGTVLPAKQDEEVAQVEGWIHLPSMSLSSLF
jgi:hypothetical protein